MTLERCVKMANYEYRKYLNAAIIGCGEFASAYLRILRKIPQVRIVAYCINHTYDDTSEMYRNHEFDLVFILTPPHTHCHLLLEALAHDSYCFVEKPMTVSLEEADKVMSAYKQTGKVIGVDHLWLFNAAVTKALSVIYNGGIGNLLGAHISILEPPTDPMLANKNHWCHKLPAGILTETLPHPLYLLQILFPDISIDSIIVKKVGSYPWTKYDEAQITLQGRGTISSIFISFNAPRYAILFDIYGDKQTLRISNNTLSIMKRASTGRYHIALENLEQAVQLLVQTVNIVFSGLRRKYALERCLRYYINGITKGEKISLIDIEAGYRNVKLLQQVHDKILNTY
jgi:predicted dehydrogenase